MRRLLSLTMAVTTTAVLLLAGCGDDDGGSVRPIDGTGSGSGSGTGAGSATGSGTGADPHCEPVGEATAADTTVVVALDEWVVKAEPAEASAGTINFHADNQGVEPHELVIAKAASPDELPLDDDGAVDESQLPEGALIGEVEVFPPGDECDGTFSLDAGSYVLFCNYEDHFSQGMATTFSVS